VKLFTSRYQHRGLADRDDLVKVRTTRGAPRWRLAFALDRCAELTPSREVFGAENWKERYVSQLDGIGVERTRRRLEDISARHGGRDLVLLCFEDVLAGEDCHRRSFAQWWFDKTGEEVPELPPPPPTTPPVNLIGGGAKSILYACRNAAKRAGWREAEIAAFEDDATSGDYEHLLKVVLREFDADLNGSD
jgi:hypothetical protein